MMSRVKRILRLFVVLICILLVQACNQKDLGHQHQEGEKYTCPMHPQIVQDKPGTCPICKMDLVPVKNTASDASLMLNDSQIQLANVTTMKVGAGSFSTAKILNGRLVTNPEQTEIISSRVAGRVEQLYVKETGRRITKGEAILQIYSEQLQVLQQDYLLQLRQVAAFPGEKIYQSLRDAAKNKLKLFGYSDAQISALAKSNRVSATVTVYATASGVVNEINVSEGQYVSEGSSLLRLESYDRIWVEADIYPSETSQVVVGSMLRIAVGGFPDQTLMARVDFVSPAIDPNTQRITIRAVLPNAAGTFQPGMQANVFLATGKVTNAISLPLDAVIRDESGAQVWIKTKDNTFTSRKVTTGAEDANQIVIISGISNGEEVVTTGAYLLYSEYVLKHETTI